MSDHKKKKASSYRYAPPASLPPLLPATLLPKPAETGTSLPSRGLKDVQVKSPWRPIQPKSITNTPPDQQHRSENFHNWQLVPQHTAREVRAPLSIQQLLSPPPSVTSGRSKHGSSVTGDKSELRQIRTECALCGTDVIYLINDEKPASGAYYCFPCHLRRERMAQIRQNHRAVVRRATIPAQPATSPVGTLSMKIARTVETLGSKHSWMSLCPSRCGTNRAFDTAALALFQGATYRAQRDAGQINDVAQRSAVVDYDKAARQLMKSFDSAENRLSDETMATVLLLYTFEVLVPSPLHERTIFHHLSAIKTILLARPNNKPPSELTRALVYTIAGWLFYALAAVGFDGPSPFEQEYFLNMEPFSLDSPPASLVSLRKLTIQLYFKMPRLIAHVRHLRAGTESDIRTVVEVATDLLHMSSRSAENQTVALLSISRTRTDTGLGDIVPYSFGFGALHWQAIINYWQCRLLVLRLCLATSSLALRLFNLQWLDVQQEDVLVREQDRCCEHVLMSWQFASDTGFAARAQMTGALNEMWGALARRDRTSQGHSTVKLRTFILEQRRKLGLGSVGERGARDMDEAMEVLGGFPDAQRSESIPASKVYEVKDDDVFTDEVELDWFGFGKDEVRQSVDHARRS